MELKERCDVAAGAGSAMGGLDPALLVPPGMTPVPAEAPPHPVPTPVDVTPRRVRTYEELDGAAGRGVYFRPHRFTALDLTPLHATVVLWLPEGPLTCALHDVSQNGVAFVHPGATVPAVGERLRLEVRFDGRVAWRGDVRIGSLRDQGAARVVGASLEGGLLDTDELLQLRDVRRWASPDGAAGPDAAPWRLSGLHRYKGLVADLRLLLEEAEVWLRAFEAELPWHVMQDRGSLANHALVARLHQDLGRHVLRLGAEIDAAWREGDPEDMAAMSAFSVRHLHRFLMQAPWMHRARHKPFGYPGDYEVMNYVYEKDFEGPSLFARAVGHAFLQTPPALAVCKRKDLMKEQVLAALRGRSGTGRPLRVLSIAAGPAREIQDLLTELDELPVPLEIVLFDQDKGALAHAHRRLWTLVESKFPGQVKLILLNESVKRLLRDVRLFEPFGGFDVIYSCGLFDYLQRATAVGLARNLFSAAAPGGQVFIANMVDHPGRWFMEQHLEWDLLYRTRKELMEIAARAAPSARIRILEEETGVNPFVELVRG